MIGDMARWSLRWGNPYTQPPGPRILAAILVPASEDCPREILDLHVPGNGYAICREVVSQRPPRQWSKEAKGRVRRNNLRRRIEKKFPLFAEQFISDELARRPSYFAGESVNQ